MAVIQPEICVLYPIKPLPELLPALVLLQSKVNN